MKKWDKIKCPYRNYFDVKRYDKPGIGGQGGGIFRDCCFNCIKPNSPNRISINSEDLSYEEYYNQYCRHRGLSDVVEKCKKCSEWDSEWQ